MRIPNIGTGRVILGLTEALWEAWAASELVPEAKQQATETACSSSNAKRRSLGLHSLPVRNHPRFPTLATA